MLPPDSAVQGREGDVNHSEHTGGVFGGGVSGDEASLASGIVDEPDGVHILKNLREVLEDEWLDAELKEREGMEAMVMALMEITIR